MCILYFCICKLVYLIFNSHHFLRFKKLSIYKEEDVKVNNFKYLVCRVDTERLVGRKYIARVDRLTRTCHHLLRDPVNLDVTQILPKTNNILSIISNDHRIQVKYLKIHILFCKSKFERNFNFKENE